MALTGGEKPLLGKFVSGGEYKKNLVVENTVLSALCAMLITLHLDRGVHSHSHCHVTDCRYFGWIWEILVQIWEKQACLLLCALSALSALFVYRFWPPPRIPIVNLLI